MILKVYAIFDVKGEVFNTPWFMHTHGQATRAFKDLVADKATLVGRNPEDFVLFSIGSFDDSSGSLIPLGKPERIVQGAEFLNVSPIRRASDA